MGHNDTRIDRSPDRRLAIVQEFAVRLLDAASVDDILASAVAIAIERLGFSQCVVYLWDEREECLVPRAARARAGAGCDLTARLVPVEQDNGLVGRAFEARCATVADASDGGADDGDPPAAAVLCVPVCHGDECFGAIGAGYETPSTVDDGDRELLVLLASLVAPQLAVQRSIANLQRVRAELEASRGLIREMIDTAPNVLYVLDYETGQMTEGLDKLAALLGYEPMAIAGLRGGVYDLIHPDDRPTVDAQEAALASGPDGRVLTAEFRLRAADGSDRWCVASSRVFKRFGDGTPRLELGSLTDVSELKAAQAEQRTRELRLRALFQNCFDCIILYDRHATCRYSTPSVERFTGYTDEEVLGRSALEFVVQADHAEAVRVWHELLERPGGHAILEQRIRHKDGREVWIEARLTNRLDDPDVEGVVSNFHDITARKEAEARVHQLANYDALTGLPNRRLLQARLREDLAQARATGAGVCLVYLDLDRFKDVNDTLGHEIGDRLLVAVGAKAVEITGAEGLVARLGGDEFAVLLPGATLDVARRLAGRLLAALQSPFHLADYELRLTASIGITRYPDHGVTSDELFSHADIAMYRAKADRNRFSVFRAADARAMRRRVALEKDLQQAVARGELELWYQPRIDLATGVVVAVEALLRWRRPDGTVVAPGTFIPVAEETGLIYRIGDHVLASACDQAARWHAAGRELRVSINLSAHEMTRADIVSHVALALDRAGLSGEHIELELTESAALADPEDGLRTLRQLKQLGVWLSIDDFGTGHSSLSYLRRLPVDCLKIDQLFLPGHAIGDERSTQSLITGIVLLAKSGGLRAVCEGVETAAQHQLLCDVGCDEAQGYYYGRPLPVAALERYLDGELSQLPAVEPGGR